MQEPRGAPREDKKTILEGGNTSPKSSCKKASRGTCQFVFIFVFK